MSISRLALAGDVEGRAYDDLLRFLSLHAATFSLTIAERHPSASMQRAIERLQPFQLDEREVEEWPAGIVPPNKKVKLYVYRVSQESIAALRQMARGLLQWQNRELPDDLCFYRKDGSVILVTVSTEDHAELHLHDSEKPDLAMFRNISVRPVRGN